MYDEVVLARVRDLAGGAAGWTSAAGAVLDLFLGGAIVHRGLDLCNPPDTVVVDGSRDALSWLADAQLADAQVAAWLAAAQLADAQLAAWLAGWRADLADAWPSPG